MLAKRTKKILGAFFKKNVVLAFIFYFLFIGLSFSQDLHFSQFFNSPLSTNPANTGFIPDADYRLGANFRNQYSSLMNIPYKTISVMGDAQVLREKIQNGWLGLGGLLMNDEAGSGTLRSSKIYGSIAYHQMLGNSSLLSAGFNLGWVNKSINPSKLKFPDQFDGRFFDNTLPTSVVLTSTSLHYFDLQAGLNYAIFPNENLYVNLGYSIHHVNQPKETFFASNASNRIPMRHIGFINAMIKLNERFIIQPNIYFTQQATATNLLGGALFNYDLANQGEKQLIFGFYYRNKDAVIPMLGFELNQLKFTFSYDATVSSLNNFNQYRGASEFSLIKNGFYTIEKNRSIPCPRF